MQMFTKSGLSDERWVFVAEAPPRWFSEGLEATLSALRYANTPEATIDLPPGSVAS